MKKKTARRNEPCPCGSGLKHKNCCAGKAAWYTRPLWTGILGLIIVLGGVFLIWMTSSRGTAEGPGTAQPGQVWSPEHGHYHDSP